MPDCSETLNKSADFIEVRVEAKVKRSESLLSLNLDLSLFSFARCGVLGERRVLARRGGWVKTTVFLNVPCGGTWGIVRRSMHKVSV